MPRGGKRVRLGKVKSMVVSKEELQRRREQDEREDAEPFIGGLTRGEFDRLPTPEQQRVSQAFFQIAASSLGYWQTCGLSPCRRAKACKGFVSQAQASRGGHQGYFPPCIRDGPHRQKATLDETARLFCGGDDDRDD